MKSTLKPFTKEEIAKLPIGFTPAETPGRKFFRDMKYKRIMIVGDPLHPGHSSIVKTFCMNCRKLTDARINFKALKFGKLDSSNGRTA